MSKQTKYSIRDLKKDFSTEEACLELIFNTLHSRECSCGGIYRKVSKRRQYQCSKCRFQIAPASTTIFSKSDTPLSLWFHALFIFSNAKSGISAKELERQLGVTYKCAWRILKQIRISLKQDATLLNGRVEVDTGFLHGTKTKFVSAIERGGKMKAKVVPDVSGQSMRDFLHENVSPKATLLTDASRTYIAVDNRRKSVNHSKEYVKGKVHINTVEGFFSHVKRSIRGTFKNVSSEGFQSYLDSFVWHYNHRSNDRERFGALLSALLVS